MSDKRNTSMPVHNGITVGDVYYTLFRQKWKILLMTLLGVGGAFVIYYGRPPSFESESWVLIKYINGDDPLTTQNASAIDPGSIGKLKNEAVILKSKDLAMEVATNFGPERILAKYGGGNDRYAAAEVINNSISVERVYEQSTILKISISLLDQGIVKDVLKELVEDYRSTHTRIHSSASQTYETLIRQLQEYKNNMDTADADLRKAKADAGVIDFEDKRRYYSGRIDAINQSISSTKIQLAVEESLLGRLRATAGLSNSILASNLLSAATNAVAGNTNAATNAVAAVATAPDTNAVVTAAATSNNASTPADAATNKADTATANAAVPQTAIDEYTRQSEYLDKLYKGYQENRLNGHTDKSPIQIEKLAKIKDALEQKKKMEQDQPGLLKVPMAHNENGKPDRSYALTDMIMTAELKVTSLQETLMGYRRELDEVSLAAGKLEAFDAKIEEMTRKYKKTSRDYDNLQTQVDKARWDQAIVDLKNANITTIQEPSQPAREQSKTPKLVASSLAAGVLLGIAWAFLSELLLDHSVRRAKEIETDMGLKLFLTIPRVSRNSNRRRRSRRGRKREVEPAEAASLLPAINGQPYDSAGAMEIAPWDNRHSLHEYFESLRDRLITYFEVNNLTHKPKLVAVTGASEGCGATTLAVGLAASLSETGDGNVLLVDMNVEHGAAQHFYKGELSANNLDVALSGETKQNAMVLDHLYVVGGNKDDKLFSMLPKRFANLMPKLQASDYDYIIFDMPAVARTGVTQRLAGFMDMMLLVVESEKTQRHVLRQSASVLNESKAKVSVVLNKTQTHVPPQLHQEF